MRFMCAGLCALILISGCAPYKYRAVPVSPSAIARTLQARSLDDADLHTWMTQAANYETTSWPLHSWDLKALTLAAFYFNADLDVARANATAADAAIRTAAMKPNPSIGGGPGYESGPQGPFTMAFAFSLPIETAGKRGYRISAATHLSAASRLQLAQTGWSVRSRTRAALTDYWFAVEAASAWKSEEGLLGRYADLVQKRLDAGEVSLPDAASARIEWTARRQALSSAEAQVQTAHAGLAAAIGIPESGLDGRTLVWSEAERPPAPALLPPEALRQAAVENRLSVQGAFERYRAAVSELQLQVARQYPDVNIGPGYNYEESAHFIALSLSTVLPLRNRNEGPIAEAEAARKVAGAKLLAEQSTVIADMDRAMRQYSGAYASLAVAETALEQLQQQQNAAGQTFGAGEADQLSVVAAQVRTSVAERARLEALQRTQVALGQVEDAMQRPISNETPDLPRKAPR